MATSKSSDTSAKKSTTTKKAAPKTTASKAAKPATSRKKNVKPAITTSEDRYKMIEVAAYYVAEKNGFGQEPLNYWLQAEKQIDQQLNA